MQPARLCSECGVGVPPYAPLGLCSQCLFSLGLAPAGSAVAPTVTAEDTGGSGVRPSNAQPGRLRYLGDYELIGEIARGGMGTVFKARQVTLNRFVAVKLISAGALATPDLLKRFRAEAEAAAGLNHPHIVPIFEIGEHAGQPYFSMRLVEGSNLSARLGRQPMANLRDAAQLVGTLARAVHFAHQRGVLHRDIKPGNVLLDQEDRPYLTDFGLAKVVQADSTLTQTHAVLGTPAYMAPEQARGDTRNVTTAVDVYGLGAVLYETLTGAAPFGGGTTFETIRHVLEEEPRRPSLWNAAIDRDLETICLKCLEKEPAHRYTSAQVLADDLDRWLRHEAIQARPSSNLEQVRKWIRRRPAIAALAASLAVALILGVVGVTVEWRHAVAQRERADQYAASLDEHLYASEMAVAWHSWAEGDAQHTRELLDTIAVQRRALRGFEWQYLARLARPDELFILTNFSSTSIEYSSDGRTLAIAGFNTGDVSILDVTSRQVLRSIQAYPRMCWRLAFSRDGRFLATCSRYDPEFKLWDVSTAQQIGTLLNSNRSENASITFSPDGTLVATVSVYSYLPIPSEVRIWDVASQKHVMSLPGSGSMTLHAEFSPDGGVVAASDAEGLVRVWNLADGSVRILRGLRGQGYHSRFSPDGKLLAAGDQHGTIILWDWAAERVIRVLTGHQGSAMALAISPDGKYLASSSRDHTARLWDMNTGEELARFLGHPTRVWDVDFSPDGRTLATTSDDGVRFWRVRPKPVGEVIREAGRSGTIGFAPDGQSLFVDEGWTNRVRFWSVLGKTNTQTLVGRDITYSQDHSILALIRDTNVVVYQAASMRLLETIPVHGPLGGPMCISPDRKLLALWSEGRPVTLDLEQRRLIATMDSDPNASRSTGILSFTTDSKLLLGVDVPNTDIRLWDARSGRKVGSLRGGHQAAISALTLSPDGRLLASASKSTIRLWDLTSRTAAANGVLNGNIGAIGALAFSPDGKTLAAGGFDGPIKLWSIPARQEIGSFKAHISNVWALSFSPDGSILASSSYDGTTRLWGSAEESDRE